jgi:Na+-translocating ferredoxin:NAD+ oxidoreductase RnfG subunit
MLTLHRLPRVYRMLYVGIAALLSAAVLSHWVRLELRHGWTPSELVAWYLGDERAMLFRKTSIEVLEDAWMNLFHHTLAFLVLGGLLVRSDAGPRTKALLATIFGTGTLVTATAPPLIWSGRAGAATAYVLALAALSAVTLATLLLVSRDAVVRRSAGHRGVAGSDVLKTAGGTAPLAVVFLMLGPAESAAQAGVYLTERAAIQEVFPAAAMVSSDTVPLDDSSRAVLEHRLGRQLESEYLFRRVYAGAADAATPLGYALVTEEKGKYRAITMLVGVDTTGRVAGVRILVYREPRGGEVSRQFFLRQYRGKQVGDPIRLNRDIINVSGATISVHSVNAAVRKTLALVECCLRNAQRSTPHAPRPLSEVP